MTHIQGKTSERAEANSGVCLIASQTEIKKNSKRCHQPGDVPDWLRAEKTSPSRMIPLGQCIIADKIIDSVNAY